jgi:nitrate/nitrite-specific signal transduction histidine kinase
VPFSDMLVRTVDDFESSSGLRAEFTASTGIPSSFAPRVQVELLRIVSEALNNVRKHADATIVRITAEASDGELLITITDNGRGFDEANAFDKGMGLQGMRERARLIGGSLRIRSELSGGTTIEIRAPIAASSPRTLTDTAERTAMALDQPDAPAEPAPADTIPAVPPAEAPDAKPTGVQT